MVTGLRVNFEGVSYSDQVVSLVLEWMAGFVWARAWAVNIEEMDVSNGPESGRNLAAISVLTMTAWCHFGALGRSWCPPSCLPVLVRYRLLLL
jgi:hypothetical protein